jgi:hypothetical protein
MVDADERRRAAHAIESLRHLHADAREHLARAYHARTSYWYQRWGDGLVEGLGPVDDDEDRRLARYVSARQRTLAVVVAAVVAMRRRYGEDAVDIHLGADDDPPLRRVLAVAVPPADDALVEVLCGAELRRSPRLTSPST